VLAALEVPLGVRNARTERRDLETKVERDATTIASVAQDPLGQPSRQRLGQLAALAFRYRKETGGRVVVVDARGRALVDTSPRTEGGETFATRPEIRAALHGTIATGTRLSETLHTRLIYVAVPVAAGGTVEGAVRITYPTSAVDARVRRYWLVLAAIAGIVLGVTAAIGFRLAAFVARPLRRLELAAAAVGSGDLSARAEVGDAPPEVRSLATVFNGTVGKLDELLRAQEEFVADASHQLRTPLTALRLRLENLTRDVAEPGRAELAAAQAEVERLAGLVDALLALARADAGGAPTGRVDLEALARERVDAWSAFAQERGVRLVLGVERAPAVTATVERVRQTIDNLVENAIEVSPQEGLVTVSVAETPAGAELCVRDEGPGMTDEQRRRAFDRFWRGRGGEGSGLGLAIARRLVEADGGTIELRPGAERGLEAAVRFDRA
jgi:signal transduction histidine kinase